MVVAKQEAMAVARIDEHRVARQQPDVAAVLEIAARASVHDQAIAVLAASRDFRMPADRLVPTPAGLQDGDRAELGHPHVRVEWPACRPAHRHGGQRGRDRIGKVVQARGGDDLVGRPDAYRGEGGVQAPPTMSMGRVEVNLGSRVRIPKYIRRC